MEFMIGANYLASNAGIDMWKNWDEDIVRNDLKILSKYNIKFIRVFPTWRDFQPVIPTYESKMKFKEYRMEDDYLPANPYYLNETMLLRFEKLCDIAKEYNIKIIVSLLSGWLSGRQFVPTALLGHDIYKDFQALSLEQKFVEGFVNRFKNREEIIAWEPGNETNCMSNETSQFVAETWIMTITNAIRANDNTRPVYSGIAMFTTEWNDNPWTLQIQGAHFDMMTPHPYPYFRGLGKFEDKLSYRTLLLPVFEQKLFESIGKKPSLIEEFGNLGPVNCNNENAGYINRIAMLTSWANNGKGLLWWCANEQSKLDFPPYSWVMLERELGLLDVNMNAKPALCEMKDFADFLNSLDFKLPKAKVDAVVILSKDTEQYNVAYMTYVLAIQSGLNVSFVHCDDKLPKADLYMLPSYKGMGPIPKEMYDDLLKQIKDGADLYLSNDYGILTDFNDLIGLELINSGEASNNGIIKGLNVEYSSNHKNYFKIVSADILYTNQDDEPIITSNKFGKGNVIYADFPLESMLFKKSGAFDGRYSKIYKTIFEKYICKHFVKFNNPMLTVTEYEENNKKYVVAINCSDKNINPNITLNNVKIKRVIRGTVENIKPFDALILELE